MSDDVQIRPGEHVSLGRPHWMVTIHGNETRCPEFAEREENK